MKTFIRLLCIMTVSVSSIWALANTKGTPLGGMGTGYVVFDARTGEFATGSRIPPGGGDMIDDFLDNTSSSCGFHFYAGGESVTKAKTENEDSKIPRYTADFGATNNVNFFLNAFGPFISGDSEFNIKMATSPLAFFAITARNDGAAAVDVAVALEFANKSSGVSGLLGGADNAQIDPESGNKGISFATAAFADVPTNPNNTGNSYIMSGCSKEGATFSAGATTTFAGSGLLSNTDGNAVAAKCSIGPGESVTFKFVMAWWRTFKSGSDRYGVGKVDEDNFRYHNYYTTSKEAAVFGMQHFDNVNSAVNNMVNRVLASNFPDWYKDRLLNNTYPLIHNSIWAKDNRAAFWEGGYGIIGTIDQGQHAAIWYMYNWPTNQWAELHYWLSNQFLRDGIVGQIHHDFNISPGMHFLPAESRFMAPWDHWDRSDYWWQPNTTDWSDLNSMCIFKAYELMMATGNRDSVATYFPKLLVTAERLFQMADEVGHAIPIQSRSTYDSDGDLSPQYACGVAVTAFRCIAEMARFLGETATVDTYMSRYEAARAEYKTELYNSSYGAMTQQGWAEGHVGGYAWASYFCLPPIQDLEFIESGCNNAWNLYDQSPTLTEKVGGWHLYTYDHLGCALTAIGKPDTALQIHAWDHEFYYTNLPQTVFWQSLFSGDAGEGKYFSYMTAPSVWRSYFTFMGYLLDNANKRLWIRPRLPSVMAGKIDNAALPNPYGWGTLYYDETGNAAQKLTQDINITYDNAVTVNEIVLKNNTGSTTPFVLLSNANGKIEGITATAEDWGVEQNIRVALSAPITIGPGQENGLHIRVFSEESGTITPFARSQKTPLGITSTALVKGMPIVCSIDQPGNVTIDLLTLKGARVATIVDRKVATAGKHSFSWNGKTADGREMGSYMGIIRLSSTGGTVSKLILNGMK